MRLALPVVAVVAALTLSSCSIFESGPERDEEGAVTTAATESVMTMKKGDCLDSEALGSVVTDVPFVPCGEPHDAEVYAQVELEDGEYPGEEAVSKQADQYCYGEFAGFVGMSYEESALDYFPMYPLQDGWETGGDREVLCLVVSLDGDVTGTLAGAAR